MVVHLSDPYIAKYLVSVKSTNIPGYTIQITHTEIWQAKKYCRKLKYCMYMGHAPCHIVHSFRGTFSPVNSCHSL